MPLVQVTNATPLRENMYRVTFSTSVQFYGTHVPGDAGDPENYAVFVGGTAYPVSLVSLTTANVYTQVDIVLGEVLTSDAVLTVTGVVDFSGNGMDPAANTATLRAVPRSAAPLTDAALGGMRDFASVNGVWVTDRGGDLDTDVGLVQLRKRLFRRLTTPKNSILHLPGYGVDVASYVKRLASGANRGRLVADIESQFRLEPEVLSAKVTLFPVGKTGLWRLKCDVRTRTGVTLRPEYDVGIRMGDPPSTP